MTSQTKTWLKRLLVIPPILVGGAVLALQIGGKTVPEQKEPVEVARSVRMIEVQPVDFVPRALGYGLVTPGRVWEAIAQVGGKVVYRNPDMERGKLLDAGTELLRIDPVDYELAVARAKANIESIEAQLAELDVRQGNYQASLKIEKRALALAEQDMERKRTLNKKGNASKASVDTAETSVLTQRQKIQDQNSQLNLLPAERRVLEANLSLQRTELSAAELDLERTVIRLPFDARIAEVTFEETQFVSAGQMLVEADSIDVAEITAQISPDRLRPLVRSDADLSNFTAAQISDLPKRLNFEARVRLAATGIDATWDARFDRISESIDPQTRTIGIIVAVDEPYRKIVPGKRPPLTKNAYVQVELRSPLRPGQIVIPRVALHSDGQGGRLVYLVGAESRLRLRPVTPGPAQADIVVIEAGLEAGDRLVVSDLAPAIEGMLLAPSHDADLVARLQAQAAGDGSIR